MAQGDLAKRGIDFQGLSLNLPNMMKQKDDAVKALTSGIAQLFKKNKVCCYFYESQFLSCVLFQVIAVEGHGSITGQNEVTVAKADGSTETLSAKNILIATGSVPIPFPGLEVGEANRDQKFPFMPPFLLAV